MSMSQKVLVAYDGSPYSKQALEKAMEFMEQNISSETHVINVNYPLHLALYGSYSTNLPQHVIHGMKEENDKIINEARELTKDYKDLCLFERIEGSASKEIINYANEHEIDLIIIGSRGLGAIGGMLLGSVSLRVTQHATCDVMVIR